MKDAYSFDIDEAGLDKSYNDMFDAYTNIFARCGLENSPVQADTGAIGGSVSAEFMVKSEVGEDEIVFCTGCDYAANMEKAVSVNAEASTEDMKELKEVHTPGIHTIEELENFFKTSGCDYAANMEKAVSVNAEASTEDMKELKEVHTPGIHTIEELENFFKTSADKFAKTLVYVADGKTVAVVVRGDRDVNETKAANAIGGAVEFELANESTVEAVTGAVVGFAGPIGLKADYVLIDKEIAEARNLVIGANKSEYHIENANYGRDFEGTVGDFRNVTEGDKCCKCGSELEIARGVEVGHIFKLGTKYSEAMGATYIDKDFRNVTEGDKCCKCGSELEIARGVEVGHIFKLGTKYSEAMGATYIDKDGKSKPIVMGCYGIGVERTAAAIIEQHHDENGITWPLAIAPYQVVVVPVNIKKAEHMEAAEKIYNELQAMGVEVLLDDRDERAGVKFKDSELIGIPMRITVGKDIVDGKVEFKLRKSEEKEVITLDEIKPRVEAEFVKNNVKLG